MLIALNYKNQAITKLGLIIAVIISSQVILPPPIFLATVGLSGVLSVEKATAKVSDEGSKEV